MKSYTSIIALGVASEKLVTPDEKSVVLAGVKAGYITLRRVGNKVIAEPTTPQQQEELK